jgi:hypothetical protein
MIDGRLMFSSENRIPDIAVICPVCAANRDLSPGGDKLARMSSTEQLSQLREGVSDEKSFLRFVAALIADRKSSARAQKENPASPWGPDAGGWKNTSIESFLEAATAWATDSDFGLKQGLAENNAWKRFAVFLNAGKIYE